MLIYLYIWKFYMTWRTKDALDNLGINEYGVQRPQVLFFALFYAIPCC